MLPLAPPLDRISTEARPYPAYHLSADLTGLAIFSAAYEGRNDAIHFARNGMVATCVDQNFDWLWKMEKLYPDSWTFVHADAWWFAEDAAAKGQTWDVVTVDPYRPMIGRAIETLPLWCSLAEQVLTIGVFSAEPQPAIPDGWHASLFPRTDEVGWLVLTRTPEDT